MIAIESLSQLHELLGCEKPRHPLISFIDYARVNPSKELYNISFSLNYYMISSKNNPACGVCAKVCPVGNVRVTDCVQFSERCITCQACVHQCPKNAIHVKREKSAKRWRHPEVTLKEIVEANDQLV